MNLSVCRGHPFAFFWDYIKPRPLKLHEMAEQMVAKNIAVPIRR